MPDFPKNARFWLGKRRTYGFWWLGKHCVRKSLHREKSRVHRKSQSNRETNTGSKKVPFSGFSKISHFDTRRPYSTFQNVQKRVKNGQKQPFLDIFRAIFFPIQRVPPTDLDFRTRLQIVENDEHKHHRMWWFVNELNCACVTNYTSIINLKLNACVYDELQLI